MPNLTVQSNGIRDDGHEAGVVRAEIVRGDLVPMPFRYFDQDEADVSFVSDVSVAHNPDGSCTGYTMNLAAAETSSCHIRHRVRGSIYGLRFDPAYVFSTGVYRDIGVLIDGVAYRVSRTRNEWDTGVANVWRDVEGAGIAIVTRDMDDRILHDIGIYAIGHATIPVGQMIFGYLAERRMGYFTPPPKGVVYSQDLTTTAATILAINSSPTRYSRAVYKMSFTNSDASAQTVTITASGNTRFPVITVPATGGGPADYTPPLPLSYSTSIKLQASKANCITAYIYSGN